MDNSFINQKIIEAFPVGISVYNRLGRCIMSNTAGAKIMKTTLDSLLENTIDSIEFWMKAGLIETAKRVIEGKQENRQEIQIERIENPVYLDCRMIPFSIDCERYLLVIIDDITERKRAEEEFKQTVLMDYVTGLPTRTLFLDRLTCALSRGDRYDSSIGLLYIDMDEFKFINDTFGHDVGDQVLKEAARRIRESIRKTDTAARIGGDEFAVILQDLHNMNDAEIIVKRIIKTVSLPIHISDTDHIIIRTISIGISIYPNHGTDAATLIKKADDAMYRVKKQGKNSYLFYD